MDLTIVGCSGSYPGPDSGASCYLVVAEGFRMLLDLGQGSFGPLQRHVGLDEIDAICVSHLHADHCLDLCAFHVVRTYYLTGGPRIPVYGPPATADRLQRAADAGPAFRASSPGQGDPPATRPVMESFEFVTLAPGSLQIGPFAVTVNHMNHPVETFGFRIEHGGRAIAYSADTGPTQSLVSLAAGADVLLSEATIIDGPGLPDMHLTARQAGEHAAQAGAGHLILTHLVPGFDSARALEEAASGYQGPVSLAAAGRQI